VIDSVQVTLVLAGALVMGYGVAALYFLKFWRQTRDRLFAWFATAFVILLVQRLALALTLGTTGQTVWYYVLRLVAFLFIAIAIIEKNRADDR
jgi:hypothetical protein